MQGESTCLHRQVQDKGRYSAEITQSKACYLSTSTNRLLERSRVCVPACKPGLGTCPVLIYFHGPVLGNSSLPSAWLVSLLSPCGVAALTASALVAAALVAAAAAAAVLLPPAPAAAAAATPAAASAVAAPPAPGG